MDVNRDTAFKTLPDNEKNGAYSNLALNKHLSKERPDDPAFTRRLVYGVLEHRMTIDHLLNAFIRNGVHKLRPEDRTILRLGVCQLAYMDSVPEYAAVNETVNLAGRYARGRVPFINAVLRNCQRSGAGVPFPDREQDPDGWLSLTYSYDPYLIGILRGEVSDENELEALLRAGNETPELTIRVNTLRTDREKLAERLAAQGFEVTYGRHSERTLAVSGSGLLDSAEYAEGLFSVQDESSVIAVETLAPKPGDTVVDVCSAPGGKTAAMAEIMNDTGRVIAFDLYEHKLPLITGNAGRLGISIIDARAFDSRKTMPGLEGGADCVLADVPCSGLGVIRRKPEIKYVKDAAGVKALPEVQLRILRAAAAYVRPGGKLLYSTCTINKGENGDVVRAFLEMRSDFGIEAERQLMPHTDGTDGFYMCLMRNRGKDSND